MRVIAFLLTLGMVAACGADGPPVRPSISTTVGIGSDGGHVSTRASATRGKWTVGVGLGL